MSSGGRRSRWLGSSNAESLQDKLRRAEDEARSEVFDTEVEQAIGDLLASYNDRDTEAVGDILDAVKSELADEFEMAIELRFGGSVSKHTYVDGLSDVDALVLLHATDVGDQTPVSLRSLLAERLRARFGASAIKEGHLAVTLTEKGQEVQLIPAIKADDHVKISNSTGDGWSSIRPRLFSEMLTKANAEMNGKLVPSIKLAKGIIAALPEQQKLSGYHTEVLAVSVFDGYTGAKTNKAMLRYFFEKLPEAVRTPRRDVTGQSVYLDEYLGARDSVARRIVADAMERISRRIRNADGAQSVPLWQDLMKPSSQ